MFTEWFEHGGEELLNKIKQSKNWLKLEVQGSLKVKYIIVATLMAIKKHDYEVFFNKCNYCFHVKYFSKMVYLLFRAIQIRPN